MAHKPLKKEGRSPISRIYESIAYSQTFGVRVILAGTLPKEIIMGIADILVSLEKILFVFVTGL